MMTNKSNSVNNDVYTGNEALPNDVSDDSILASDTVSGTENSEDDDGGLYAEIMASEPYVAVASTDTVETFDIDSEYDALRKESASPSISENELRQKHESEFKASAIHPDFWENFKTLYNNKCVLDYLLIGNIPRTNTGRVSTPFLQKYASLHTGYVTETVGSDFCQFKPDEPRAYSNADGKLTSIKYESPPKYPTDIIRLRHLPHWITGGKSAEEWWESVVDTTEGLWITEGAKKAASLLSLGLPAIGLPGIFNTHTCKGGDPIPELLRIIKNKKRVYLVFDAPDKLTQHAGLENSYRRLKNLILEINPKCEVLIVCWEWWMGKGVDDAIAAGHLDKASLLKSALPYYEGLMFLNTNIPAYKRITGKRYLTLEDVDNFENKITAMVVGKDGGKSTTAGAYLRYLADNVAVLNPTHRIKLGQQLAPRLGTQYLNGRHKTTDIKNRLTLCINSLNVENVNPEDYKGCVIFLDEVVQLLDFLFSGTIKKAPEVIQNFVTLLTNASKIIIADADLDHIDNYKRIDSKYIGLIQRHLNISLNEKDPMKLIDSLALKLAMTRKGKGRKKLPNGDRISQASYQINDNIRYDIFPIWDENNNIDMILTQMSEIRDTENKIRESLRSGDKTEADKEVLRNELTQLLKTEDAIREELNQINEIRNQRKIDYEASRLEANVSDTTTLDAGFDPTDGSISPEKVREWWAKVEHNNGYQIAEKLGLEKFVKLCEIVGRKLKSSFKSLNDAWTQYNLLEFY